MFMQILTHTPKWVFALFVVLVWLGMKQMLPRRVGMTRATVLPLVMMGLSLYGVTSAFGETPDALLAWLAGAAITSFASYLLLQPTTTRYDAESRNFSLPGSPVPLALFMGIFFTKYAVGASIGMQPTLAHSHTFILIVSTLYGAFSGIFMARATHLWRVALAQSKAAAPTHASA